MTKSDVLGMLEAAFTRYHTGLPRVYPRRKEITVTLPTGVTTYTYTDPDGWITANTSCYAHDLGMTGITVSVSWSFANGSVTFTLGEALTSAVTFNFGMIKGGVG